MKSIKSEILKWSAVAIGLTMHTCCLAQGEDSTRNQIGINGRMSVTNNGFSFVPAFTLDKPAGLVFITVDVDRWSFQNQTQYALNGRPWSISFVTRYKIIDKSRATITAGVYFPSTTFFESTVVHNGIELPLLQSQQSVTPELNVAIPISRYVKAGILYLFNQSIDGVPPLNGHYAGIWLECYDLKITRAMRFAIDTQLFYLNLDGADGTESSPQNTLIDKQS